MGTLDDLHIVLVHNKKVTPLASIPMLSQDYCKENGIKYQTEPELVTEWVERLGASGQFSKKDLSRIHFLLDSGYDCKAIQRTIKNIGSEFVMSLRNFRSVRKAQNPSQGKHWSVKEYFKRHKKSHKAKTIRFKGSGKQTKHFNVRLATGLSLKGVSGEVNIACSKVSVARK